MASWVDSQKHQAISMATSAHMGDLWGFHIALRLCLLKGLGVDQLDSWMGFLGLEKLVLPEHSERLKLPIGVPIHVVFFWILFLCGHKIKHHSVGCLYTSYEISPPFYPIQSPLKHDIPVETFK